MFIWSFLSLPYFIKLAIRGPISPTRLQTAFNNADPKRAKRQSSYQCLFALLGSASAKDASKMLMISTPGYRSDAISSSVYDFCHQRDLSIWFVNFFWVLLTFWFEKTNCCTRIKSRGKSYKINFVLKKVKLILIFWRYVDLI